MFDEMRIAKALTCGLYADYPGNTQTQAEDGAGGGEWDRGVGVAWRLGSQQKK